MTTSLIDYQLIKQILPNYEEYESAERAIFIIDDNFEILYTNSYTLNMLGYDLLELKEIGFRKVADIYESEFSIFYEARKDLGAHNRLRLNKKNLNLYCINATYQKVIIGFKEYFIITKYLGDLPFKVDFLASDMYFHSSDAIAIVGLDSTIQSVNHAFTRLFGFYSHEVKGKNIVKLLSQKMRNYY